MKKLIILAALSVLAANAYSSAETILVRIGGSDSRFSSISVYKDIVTGCEYIVAAQAGVTPHIGADYMHMGCKGYEGQQ